MPPAAFGAAASRSGSRDFAGHEVLEVEQVGACALGDAHQRRHLRDLFDLFLEEPLHELLAEVVAFVAGGAGQPADLLGDRALQVECEADGLTRRLEGVAYGIDGRDLGGHAAVDEVLHEHHRVIALLDRLAVEEFGQLRQVGAVEVHRDRKVLLRRAEFAADLVVKQAVKLGIECVNRSHDGRI